MTVQEALKRARQILAAGNIEDWGPEAEVLLRHVLGITRVQLYLEPGRELSHDEREKLRDILKRRLNHEPTAYITGHREFYGLDFAVDSNVLIPRPETELLVEKALGLAKYVPGYTIADIGTGCGAIAITLALHLPEARVIATDISAAALNSARRNCHTHGATERVTLLEGDLLSPLPEPVDMIVANLPYVREGELSQVNTAGFEPSLALYGGTDGLAQIRRLCGQVGSKLRPGGSLLLEIGKGQSQDVIGFLGTLFPAARVELFPDLNGIDRVVSLTMLSASRTIISAGSLHAI